MLAGSSVLVLLLCAGPGLGAKILVTTIGVSGSQNLLLYRLADMLGERGHSVTMLKGEVLPEAKSQKLKFAKEIVYPLVGDEKIRATLRKEIASMSWSTDSDSPMPFGAMKAIASGVVGGCENLLVNNTALLERLRGEKFDVALIHFMDMCIHGAMPHLGIKGYVQVSTAMMLDTMAYYSGVPHPSSWVPSAPIAAAPPLDIIQRGKSMAITTAMTAAFRFIVCPYYTSLFRRALNEPDYPDLSQIYFDTSLYFINSDPFFEYPRPILHNIVYMGGITMQKPEALSPEWEEVMTKAKKGVVIFSLGSVVDTKTMPLPVIRAFLNAFKAFPDYTFIWRLERELDEVSQVPNVKISKWMPQRDLLGHPKMKAFITHGGYNSLTEATYMGVPLVMFPLFGDQYANVVRVERLGVGVRLAREGLDQHSVQAALHSVLDSAEVAEAASRLGSMIRKKPISSYDAAMGWVEFLAEFRSLETLLPDSRNINLISYYMLDVLAILAAVIGIIFWLLCRLVRGCCCRSKAQPKGKGKRKSD